MAANEVCWFDSDDAGATILNNAAGSLDAVLYACLVTGSNAKSITSISVTGGVATAVCAGHGYSALQGKSIEIAGAATALINGRKQLSSAASGSFTFPAPGVADTGSVAGTITAKRSPLGWARVANASNKSIYARTDPAATAMVLCLDDTGAGVASATQARVVMAEAWTDASTFTGLSPTTAQLSGGNYISKGANSAGAKKWAIFGDSRFIYIFTESSSSSFASFGGLTMAAFGDFVSDRAGDAYGALISAPVSADALPWLGKSSTVGQTVSSYDLCFARLSNQLGASVRGTVVGPLNGQQVGASGPFYPSPVNNGGALQSPILLAEDNSTFGGPIRGVAPGLLHPLCRGMNLLHLTVLPNVTGSTRALVPVATMSGSSVGCVVIDVTGPWR